MVQLLRPTRQAAVTAAILTITAFNTSVFASPSPVKIGVGTVFPISYRDANGKWTGFAIDVLTEAARRENLPVQWLSTANSKAAEEDLRSGRIDMMPAGMVTPERQRAFYVSQPWWSTELTIVSRTDRRKTASM